MIWAQFETPHFTFDVFAEDKEKALFLLQKAWAYHARKHKADPAYLAHYAEDIQYHEVSAGAILQDREPVKDLL